MNKKYHVLVIISILASGLLFLPACRSTKNLVKRNLRILPFEQLYQNMVKSVPSFSYLNAKLGVNYQKEGKEPIQFRVQMRMKKDSIIWMSLVPAMGIEAARVVLTADSVKLLNRLKKNYVLGSYHLLDSLMHTSINFDMLQALLLGENLHYPVLDSSATIDGQAYLLTMKMQVPPKGPGVAAQQLTQKVWLDPDSFNMKELSLSEDSMQGKNLQIYYDQYQHIDGKTFPLKMQIVINARKKIIINISYKKTEVNIPHRFPFIIPGKYKKLI